MFQLVEGNFGTLRGGAREPLQGAVHFCGSLAESFGNLRERFRILRTLRKERPRVLHAGCTFLEKPEGVTLSGGICVVAGAVESRTHVGALVVKVLHDFDFGVDARQKPAVQFEEKVPGCECGIALLGIERGDIEKFVQGNVYGEMPGLHEHEFAGLGAVSCLFARKHVVEKACRAGFVFNDGVEVGLAIFACGKVHADDGEERFPDGDAVHGLDGFDLAPLSHEPAFLGDILHAFHVENISYFRADSAEKYPCLRSVARILNLFCSGSAVKPSMTNCGMRLRGLN